MFLFDVVDPFVIATGWDDLAFLNIHTIIIRLVMALICGGILGFERAMKHHAAGFRTYILVCLGATIAMLTNEFLSLATGLGDGARLGAQVISGIGFLGAGSIMFTSKSQVKGLTTAAGLWACACLGLAIGIGFYSLAVIATILMVLVLAFLPTIERKLTNKARQFAIHIEFKKVDDLVLFVTSVRDLGFKVMSVERNHAYAETDLSVYTIGLKVVNKMKIDHNDFLDMFSNFEYVNYVEEIN